MALSALQIPVADITDLDNPSRRLTWLKNRTVRFIPERLPRPDFRGIPPCACGPNG